MSTANDAGGPPLPAGIGSPAQRALAAAGITDLAGLSRWTRRDVANLHGLGPKALGQLAAALEAHGLAFAPSPDAAGQRRA